MLSDDPIFAQKNTSPSYRIENGWILKNEKRFFAKIAGYFYLERIPEYQTIEENLGPDGAWEYLCHYFNVFMLPSWPLFSEEGKYQKLAYENCYHPAFDITGSNSYYKGIRSSDRIVLMTQITYMMDILRYAGLNNFGDSVGYFNKNNDIKTKGSDWVVGPSDMQEIFNSHKFKIFFGSENRWGHFQSNTNSGLMKDRGEFFWFLSDEPERNGNDWYLPNKFLQKLFVSLNNDKIRNICFVSFGPVKNGNKYLYSEKYSQKVPPNNLKIYNKKFYYSYGNTYNELKNNFIKTLKYYKNTGNVFGVNDYTLIYEAPEYAGYLVDWLKREMNNTPVWFWVAPYQSWVDTSLLKCQVFTAIVHGANGIGFWIMPTEDSSNDTQLEKAINISRYLNEIETILVCDPATDFMKDNVWLTWKDIVHLTIRKLTEHNYVMIAVNTSKKNSINFIPNSIPPFKRLKSKILAPLEVSIFYSYKVDKDF